MATKTSKAMHTENGIEIRGDIKRIFGSIESINGPKFCRTIAGFASCSAGGGVRPSRWRPGGDVSQ